MLKLTKINSRAQSHPVEIQYSQTNLALIFAPVSSTSGTVLNINTFSFHSDAQGNFWQEPEMHNSLLHLNFNYSEKVPKGVASHIQLSLWVSRRNQPSPSVSKPNPVGLGL